MPETSAIADLAPVTDEPMPAAEGVQASLVQAIHAYARLVEDGVDVPPFTAEHGVTQTEAVLLASRLLQAADVELFELAMWQIAGGK